MLTTIVIVRYVILGVVGLVYLGFQVGASVLLVIAGLIDRLATWLREYDERRARERDRYIR